MAVFTELIYGDFEGPKAGSYRWIVHRTNLLRLWEWFCFHASPWMRRILMVTAARASQNLPDVLVSPEAVEDLSLLAVTPPPPPLPCSDGVLQVFARPAVLGERPRVPPGA